MAVETVGTIITSLKAGVDFWKGRENESERETRLRLESIDLVLEAVQSTRAYLYDKDVLLETDRKVERKLSKAWQKASSAIRLYDEDLYNSSQVKSLGWGDPRRWDDWKKKAKTIDLDEIEKNCIELRDGET